MITPKPPVKLEGHCSVIYDGSLYTYSANGFASLPLERNGTWSELKMGEPVDNAECVTAAVDGKPDRMAMYVIGGTGSSSDYPGLQRYSFEDQKWETLTPPTRNLYNRTNHGVAYLKTAASIFIYGGSQTDNSVASADNFVLQTFSPYRLLSSPIESVPPAKSPVLLSWSDDQVALVGGATDSQSIHLFEYANPAQGQGRWEKAEASLAKTIPDNVKCALMRGSDGSKVLESFDMSATPNAVSSVVLLDANGKPAKPGQPAGQSRKRRRDASLKDYPTYDNSLASQKPLSDYSLAQGDDGLVVMSGGSGTDTLSMFNQTSNSWVNTTKLFFGTQSPQQILPSLTATPSATAAPTSSPSSSHSAMAAPAATGDHSNKNIGTIIGATLGAVLGVAAILVLILFCLKQKKNKMKQGGRHRGAGGGDGGNDRLSFQDQGMEPLTRSAYPMAKGPVPMASSSVDSLAIFGGEGNAKTPKAAGGVVPKSTQPKPSPLTGVTSSEAVSKAQEAVAGGQAGDRRTDEGWSKYFQGNNATDLARTQPEQSNEDPTKTETRQSAWPMTSLTPLNFGFLDQPKPLGHVYSGSPTTEHASSSITDGHSLVIPEGQSARISSADSISLNSDDDYYRRRSSGYRDSQWTGAGESSWIDRPPSSTYSRSNYYNSVMNPQDHGFTYETTRNNGRRSSVIIPDTLDESPRPGRKGNTDMSWLNLNADR